MTKTPLQITAALRDLQAAREKVWADMEPLQKKSKELADKYDALITEKWELPEFAEQDFSQSIESVRELCRDANRNRAASSAQNRWIKSFDLHLSDSGLYDVDLDLPLVRLMLSKDEEISEDLVSGVFRLAVALADTRETVRMEIFEHTLGGNGHVWLEVPTDINMPTEVTESLYYNDPRAAFSGSLADALAFVAKHYWYDGGPAWSDTDSESDDY